MASVSDQQHTDTESSQEFFSWVFSKPRCSTLWRHTARCKFFLQFTWEFVRIGVIVSISVIVLSKFLAVVCYVHFVCGFILICVFVPCSCVVHAVLQRMLGSQVWDRVESRSAGWGRWTDETPWSVGSWENEEQTSGCLASDDSGRV